MADFPQLIIDQPELAEMLMRGLALKGDLPRLLEAGFRPQLLVEDYTRPEFMWLRRIVRLSQSIDIAAVAGQFSQGAFAPIAGAGRIMAVVEQLIISNGSAVGANVKVDSQPNITVAAAPGVPKSALDDRALPFNQLQFTPSYGLVSATAVVALTGLGALTIGVPATSSVVLPLNWVFTNKVVLSTPAPSLLLVQHTAVNTGLTFAVVWRERVPVSSELS